MRRADARDVSAAESIALRGVVALALGVSVLAAAAATSGGGSGAGPVRGVAEASVLPGAWPREAERELLDLLLVGDFFPLPVAVCVLEGVQAHVSHAEYEDYMARFGVTATNPVYGEFIGQAMEKCSIPPRD